MASAAPSPYACLRVELHPFGVQVGLVEPSVVDNDPWHEVDEVIEALEAGMRG